MSRTNLDSNNKLPERNGPIFIVGSPRSGTTLLRNILNRHPLIGLCDETAFFHYVYTRRCAFGKLNNREARRYLIDKYFALNWIKRLGLDLDILSERLMLEGDSYKSFFDSIIRFWATEHGKICYGEKTPHHALFSEILCEWYPNCKLIHLVRDPRDVAASLLRMTWGRNSVLGSARTWLRYTKAAMKCKHLKNYIHVSYEQLVMKPETELRRICDFLKQEYQPSMLEIGEQVVSDRLHFQRSHSKLTKNRVDKWREELSHDQVALIEWLVETYMSKFDYKPTGRRVSKAKIATALVAEFFDTYSIMNYPRMWYFWIQPTKLANEERWIDV